MHKRRGQRQSKGSVNVDNVEWEQAWQRCTEMKWALTTLPVELGPAVMGTWEPWWALELRKQEWR
jgi:hypothetical protein